MNNINLKQLFLDLQDQMTSKLTTNKRNIRHSGTLGDTSEINWIDWLRTYLPKRYSVDKAFIIDSNNDISDQIDLVIYDQQYSPFVFNQDGAIYIPAESVYAIFEIKQTLNKEHIQYAGNKAKSVRLLKRTSSIIYHAGGEHKPKKPHNIIAGILTFSSEWKEPLGGWFEKNISELEDIQRLDIGCSLQNGSFLINYMNGNDNIKIEKSSPQGSLIFFFLKLLIELQKIGTVPAIDINEYAKAIDSI